MGGGGTKTSMIPSLNELLVNGRINNSINYSAREIEGAVNYIEKIIEGCGRLTSSIGTTITSYHSQKIEVISNMIW